MKYLSSFITILTLMLGMNAQGQNDVKQDATKNQVQLKLTDGTSKYYNTADIQELTFDNGNVTAGRDQYSNNVSTISFAKGISAKVNITEAKGWLESAYVKFNLYDNIQKYNVYVKGGQYAEYTKIDSELVRNYGSYGRADVVGLKAGTNYQLKVVPVNGDDTELIQFASETEVLETKNYSRQGFAFKNGYEPGAYQADGTLKPNAKVLYVTKDNAKTISTDVAGAEQNPCVGLQTIIAAYEKGQDKTPIAFRFIGLIKKGDLDAIGSSEEGIQVKGRKADSELNLTFEGIGDDATVHGFGFLIRNSKSVEFRNFGIMRCMDDGLSLDTDNSNIWIHHMDFFYGPNGGGDHAKGDGSCDVKSDSKLVTVSYNRFWDTGKTNMFGMKSESGPNYISYDHNWFDHSDSRHPRVRTMSVHVWNNYFDNVAKYGVGATSGSSVFVENNYFLKTKKPILSSMQGTDALGSGTFSGEDGGMIKAFGNHFDTTISNFKYYTQNNPASTGYDAYATSTRNEQVPATEVTKQGGTSYNNFDTDASLMYEYDVVAAEDVPALVTGYYGAGRMNHGDFTYSFPDNVGSDDADSAYDSTLGGLLDNYQTSLLGIFGEESASGEEEGGGDTPTPEGTIVCSFDKTGVPSNTFFTVVGNGSNSKGKATVDGVEYTTCLKMESSTSIKFTLTDKRKMTLYFADTETASIKINGTKISGSGSTYSQVLETGSYELTKDKSVNLFYIKLEPVTE
ncbi:MAG: pectate lyase [Prevotella sp.]|nr:pectate lyase [Prevotella sp.]